MNSRKERYPRHASLSVTRLRGRPPDTATIRAVKEGEPIRLLLLDYHDVVRVGLADIVEAHTDIDVVASVGSIADAVVAMDTNPAEIALVDVRLNHESGLDFCSMATKRWPEVRTIILTADDSDQTAIIAANAGAWAVLTKQIRGDMIPTTIRRVASGERLLSAAQVAERERRFAHSELGRVSQLSERELEIFRLIGDGASNRQIADELYIAEKTVKNQITGLLAKLQLERRTEVAALAARYDERMHHQ